MINYLKCLFLLPHPPLFWQNSLQHLFRSCWYKSSFTGRRWFTTGCACPSAVFQSKYFLQFSFGTSSKYFISFYAKRICGVASQYMSPYSTNYYTDLMSLLPYEEIFPSTSLVRQFPGLKRSYFWVMSSQRQNKPHSLKFYRVTNPKRELALTTLSCRSLLLLGRVSSKHFRGNGYERVHSLQVGMWKKVWKCGWTSNLSEFGGGKGAIFLLPYARMIE